ncbi:MAG: hypothetical protein EOO43_05455 [Flavobacterium sp.]|nr:MAG: hypothetical protein EOO43_05455 [Flavobacterium sp.]
MTSSYQYILDFLYEISEPKFNRERLAIVFDTVSNAELIAKVDQSKLIVDSTSKQQSEVDLSLLPFQLYFDEKDFLQRINKGSWGKSIFILKEKAFYNPLNRVTEIKGTVDENYWLINNNHCYFDLLTFLKQHEHPGGAIFYFVDYFSWDTGTMVFTTLKKEGQLKIKFTSNGIDLPGDLDLTRQLKRLTDAFADPGKQFPKFIKSEIVVQLSKFTSSELMIKLVENLSSIINIAEQNFEIYLHDLSLENLKKDYIDYKNKYFNQFRDILSKLTNQVIGLPVTIAASIFGTYKISDSPITLLIILTVFLLYVVYSIFLLKLQKTDISDIKIMFDKDFLYLENSPFFQKFPDQLIDFKNTKVSFLQRVKYLNIAVDVYYVFFVVGVLLFTLYILIQLMTPALTITVFLLALFIEDF